MIGQPLFFMRFIKVFISVTLFISSTSLFAFTATLHKEKLPVIAELSSRNEVFKEYSRIVEENYKAAARGSEIEPLFFLYKVPKNTTIMMIASRCNIPYETIATLNNISSNTEKIENMLLIIPAMSGLFVEQNGKAVNEIQIILSERFSSKDDFLCYNEYIVGNSVYTFYPSERFSPVERSYFLDTALSLPLDKKSFYISSEFGKRKNPFSNEWKNHNGIDFAAPEGTPVMAVKNGIISVIVRNDKTFGNYIILSHDGGKKTSVYAHLSKISVAYGDTVKKGDVIGLLGATGMVTGPHLHFEIRTGGVAEDPAKILKL